MQASNLFAASIVLDFDILSDLSAVGIFVSDVGEDVNTRWPNHNAFFNGQAPLRLKETGDFGGMGRFMMNGVLLSQGFPIINVPAKRQKEFNQLMLSFYLSGDMSEMNAFLRSCLNVKIIDNFKSSR